MAPAPSRSSARRRRIVAVAVIVVVAGGVFVTLRFLRDRTPERVANFRAMAAERARAADPRAAEALLRRAAEADPSNAQVQFDLGLVLVALDRAEEAERAFRMAAAATPGVPDAALEAARLAAARGDLPTAMSVLDAAIVRDAAFARAQATRAGLRLRAGDPEGGARGLRRADGHGTGGPAAAAPRRVPRRGDRGRPLRRHARGPRGVAHHRGEDARRGRP